MTASRKRAFVARWSDSFFSLIVYLWGSSGYAFGVIGFTTFVFNKVRGQ